jgi:hypothetical protein
MKEVVIDKMRPEIPDFVLPNARQLIIDCWADNPDDRLSFASVLDRLKHMKFKIAPEVHSSRVQAFVSEIEHYETSLGTEVEAISQEMEQFVIFVEHSSAHVLRHALE